MSDGIRRRPRREKLIGREGREIAAGEEGLTGDLKGEDEKNGAGEEEAGETRLPAHGFQRRIIKTDMERN